MEFPRRVANLVASLRGLPEDRSRSRPRDIQPLEKAINRLIEKYQLTSDSTADKLMRQWKHIMGQHAERCAPEKIEHPHLYVRVSNPVVRQEIIFNERNLVRKIQAATGDNAIKHIRFR